MGRLVWPLALVVTFGVGMAAGTMGGKLSAPSAPTATEESRETVTRLEQQVTALQARLRSRESMVAARQMQDAERGEEPDGRSTGGRRGGRDRFASAAIADGTGAGGGGRGAAAPQAGTPGDQAAQRPAGATRPATVDAALERFYKWLDSSKGLEGRESWQRWRELVNDFKAMGDAGSKALMHVLATGSDTEERRAAARMLGTLQVGQALPALRDVLDKEDDLLLRRAAASAIRQLQSPESVPVMERMLANPNEDRFVRLSAASGLAQSGRAQGVTGLVNIFEEATVDGRGREMAFRALANLKDDRSLPFMRQVLGSQIEPSYRLQAIKYLTTQGDQQSLATLQVIAHSPNEQPSIRDAAAQAHAAISAR